MKMAQKSVLRMKNILKNDKERISLPLLNMIKSDVFNVVVNYFDIILDDIDISYSIDNNCMYSFNISFKSNRIKKINFLNH